MRSLVQRAAVLGATIAAAITFAPAAQAASATTFSVMNTASVEEGMPSGALLTIRLDGRASAERGRGFGPWVMTAPDGLYVEASCWGYANLMRLPIRFVGDWATDRTRVDVYLPNSTLPEPYGTCADDGLRSVQVHPAPGFGTVIMRNVPALTAHPGVFMIGDAPDGEHVDGSSRARTRLTTCNDSLPADPTVCPVRSLGVSADLLLRLTGSDKFLCDPCGGNALVFELAPVVGGVIGTFVPHDLVRLARISPGFEEATVRLRAGTATGEYRLRVHDTQRDVVGPALRVEFGAPR